MTILVTGVRGGIGGRVVARLAAAGYPVRGSARYVASRPVPRPAGVEVVELDVSAPRDVGAALRGVEAAFVYPAHGGIEEFLAAARAADVRHVVLLSSPSAYEAGEFDRVIGRVHRAVEQSLEASGLAHTVLYPSWLASNARRDWGEQIRVGGRVAMAHPDAQVSPIHLEDIAEVAVELLTRERHRARRQVSSGPESLRLRDIVAVLGEELGRPLAVDELSREQALARREPWLPEPVAEALVDVAAAAVGVAAPLTNTVERITGHPARAFRTWARAHRVDFASS